MRALAAFWLLWFNPLQATLLTAGLITLLPERSASVPIILYRPRPPQSPGPQHDAPVSRCAGFSLDIQRRIPLSFTASEASSYDPYEAALEEFKASMGYSADFAFARYITWTSSTRPPTTTSRGTSSPMRSACQRRWSRSTLPPDSATTCSPSSTAGCRSDSRAVPHSYRLCIIREMGNERI